MNFIKYSNGSSFITNTSYKRIKSIFGIFIENLSMPIKSHFFNLINKKKEKKKKS